MTVYCIDPLNGCNKKNGLSEDCPLINDENIRLLPGDTKEELIEQGDFFDECFGYLEKKTGRIPQKHKVYLYSKGNPALVYKSIECVTYGSRCLANNGHDIIFKDLKFINSGVHAIEGEAESKNIKVLNCEFENIGGCVWDYDLKVRFGNGVEF